MELGFEGAELMGFSTGAIVGNGATLPAARYDHAMSVWNGRLYVTGGLNVSVQSTVYSAPINANGTVGTWTTETNSLPAVRYDHAMSVWNGRLYVTGGYNGTIVQSTVYSTPINANGTVGTWTTETNSLPAARYAHAMSVWNGRLYVTGGSDGLPQSTVCSNGIPFYSPSATYFGPTIDLGSAQNFSSISWTQSVSPSGSSVTVYIATTSASNVGLTTFTAVTNGQNLNISARYIQYKIAMTPGGSVGSPPSDQTPTITDVTITYTPVGPPANPVIQAVYVSSITANWGLVTGATGYTLVASTESANPPVTIWASSTTVDINFTTATVYTPALSTNTTYYLFVQANGNGGSSLYTAYPATSTLAALVTNPQVYAVYETSVTVNWVAVGAGLADGYVLEASTSSNYIPMAQSSTTTTITLSTLTVSGLNGETTYYFRVGSLNHNNIYNYAVDGSTQIPLIIGVSVGMGTYSFGTVQMGATTISTQSIILTNTGNTGERYQLSATTSTAGTPWTVLAATPTVHNGLVLFGTFHNVQPSTSSFTSQDVISGTNQPSQTVSQGGRYTVDDTQTGVGVPYNDTRQLWFYLNMPLTTSTTIQQGIAVSVTAEQSP